MVDLIARVTNAPADVVLMIDGAQVVRVVKIWRDSLIIVDDRGRTFVADGEGREAIEIRKGNGKAKGKTKT